MTSTPRHKNHIAVIGAGAFGGWTALYLLRMGARVTLLDAWGPGNSRSSSGGESRAIRGLYGPDRIYVQWVARAFALWRENQQRWNTELYRRTGLLWMFPGDDEYARASLPLAEEFGLRVDRLEPGEAERRFPQFSFDGVRTLYFESDAGYLRARHACHVVCEQFRREGGTFLEAAVKPGPIRREAMERIELSDGGHLSADHYVFACGPWMGEMFPDWIGESVRPTRQEVHFFGTPPGDSSFEPGRFPIWVDYGERLFYGFPNIGRRGIKIADDTRGEMFDPTAGDRRPSAESVARAREFLARRFPRLRSAPLVESRVCQYANTPDGHLIIDRHPGAGNVWLAGGGSGHGFKLGPALGEHIAGCVLGEAQPEPMFSVARLTKTGGISTQFGRPK